MLFTRFENHHRCLRRACGLSEQHINLLLYPFLAVGRIGVCRLLVDQHAQVLQLIDEVEELADVIRNRRLENATSNNK